MKSGVVAAGKRMMKKQPQIEHSPEARTYQLSWGEPNSIARRREITLREADWTGWDIRALANDVAKTCTTARQDAEDRYRLAPGEPRQGRRGCVGRIVDGLRADLFFEQKWRKGQKRSYCYPIFFVDRSLGGANRQFRIGPRCPYPLAYARAVAHYVKQRGLSWDDTITALCLVPPRALFFDIITHREAQGYKLSREQVMRKLDFPDELEGLIDAA